MKWFKQGLTAAALLSVMSFSAHAVDCSDIEWHQDVLDKFPNAAEACQSVVMRDGEVHVEMIAEFVRMRPNNRADLLVHANDGTKKEVTVKVDNRIKVNDEVAFDTLPRGYEMQFFIPNDRFEVVHAVSQMPVEEVVIEEIAYLPSTASVWPLVGSLGAMFLGIAGALRLRRRK
ncbi:hypothetical protein [Ferrimonas marina]|uniref:LPXTG-motif cell wall anchor domain-containing protein n=1 Tax=Ferrimonas marina TaxID=299255 RepID=A0A1M5YUS8_9GAMM|nr:hypothetical protein [Ferrimonas marina]SHI15791.1 hypothetical protein SAMN02745129_4488 [Ferrimonas marina]